MLFDMKRQICYSSHAEVQANIFKSVRQGILWKDVYARQGALIQHETVLCLFHLLNWTGPNTNFVYGMSIFPAIEKWLCVSQTLSLTWQGSKSVCPLRCQIPYPLRKGRGEQSHNVVQLHVYMSHHTGTPCLWSQHKPTPPCKYLCGTAVQQCSDWPATRVPQFTAGRPACIWNTDPTDTHLLRLSKSLPLPPTLWRPFALTHSFTRWLFPGCC